MNSASPPLVKICGLNDAEAVDAAVEAGADYLGFIIFPQSPRHVSPKQAGALARRKGQALSVAVLADPDETLLDEAGRHMRPDIIQLHGGESPMRCLDARHYTETGTVWKALGVSTANDLEPVAGYARHVDGYVFDASPPGNACRPGGHGIAWDYTLLRGCDPGKPWLLAGGLNVSTVSTAIMQSGAEGVDVVSGVEMAPGVKSIDKIRAFITAAKSAFRERARPTS